MPILTTKKMAPTTTKKTTPSLRMTTHYLLRTKEVQMYQLTLRDRCFFPTCRTPSYFLRRASPEQAAWPTAPLMGCNATTNATPTTISQSLPPTTVVTQTQEDEERDAGWGEAITTTRPQRRAARDVRERSSVA